MNEHKLIYITSFSRSGSTLLDIVLGNAPCSFSAGELSRLATDGWRKNQVCGCGAFNHACAFWSAVRRKWEKATGASAEEYAALQNQFERLRRFPRLLLEKRKKSSEFLRYEALTLALLSSIKEVSGQDVIIDSSKAPMRGLALSMMNGLDVTLIHLVRDVRGVANSLVKTYPKAPDAGIEKYIQGVPVMRTALLWFFFNGLVLWVRKYIDKKKSTFLRYEDFVEEPALKVQKIYEIAGVDKSIIVGVLRALSAEEELDVGPHIVSGNRLRMNDRIRLNRDDGWKNSLSLGQKCKVVLCTWPLLKKMGYKIRSV